MTKPTNRQNRWVFGKSFLRKSFANQMAGIYQQKLNFNYNLFTIFIKNDSTPASFSFIFVFTNTHNNFYSK